MFKHLVDARSLDLYGSDGYSFNIDLHTYVDVCIGCMCLYIYKLDMRIVIETVAASAAS